MKSICIYVEGDKPENPIGWDRRYFSKRSICIPHRKGLENILDPEEIHDDEELKTALHPIFFDGTIQLKDAFDEITRYVSKPFKYTAHMKVGYRVEENFDAE